MTFDERLTWTLIGCAIGFLIGYFVRALADIRRTVHNVEDRVNRKNELGLVRKPLLLDFVLLVVVILVAYAAIQSQAASNALKQRNHKDLVTRCVASVDGRDVQRATVEAVYTLALGATDGKNGRIPKNLTEEQRQNYNRFIRRANAFRSSMYEKIKPPPYCLPYVKDDNVKPPTAPFPTLPKEPKRAKR